MATRGRIRSSHSRSRSRSRQSQPQPQPQPLQPLNPSVEVLNSTAGRKVTVNARGTNITVLRENLNRMPYFSALFAGPWTNNHEDPYVDVAPDIFHMILNVVAYSLDLHTVTLPNNVDEASLIGALRMLGLTETPPNPPGENINNGISSFERDVLTRQQIQEAQQAYQSYTKCQICGQLFDMTANHAAACECHPAASVCFDRFGLLMCMSCGRRQMPSGPDYSVRCYTGRHVGVPSQSSNSAAAALAV